MISNYYSPPHLLKSYNKCINYFEQYHVAEVYSVY